MSNINLAVIYYSSTGTNYQMAQWAEAGAKEAGVEVKVLKVPETAPQAAIIASPGYTDPSIFASGGNPYGTSVTVDQDGKMKEDVREAVKHQARRTAEVAKWVKAGLLNKFHVVIGKQKDKSDIVWSY